MFRKQSHSSLTYFSGLVVIAMFAVLSLLLVLTGQQSFTSVVNKMDKNNSSRMIVSYLTNKVRTGDATGAVSVETVSGTEQLVLKDGDYRTVLYVHNGFLKELYLGSKDTFRPESGENLVAARFLHCTREKGLLTMTVVDGEGQTLTIPVSLHSAEGGAAS